MLGRHAKPIQYRLGCSAEKWVPHDTEANARKGTRFHFGAIQKEIQDSLIDEVVQMDTDSMKEGELPNWQNCKRCPILTVAVADVWPEERCEKYEKNGVVYYGDIPAGWECKHDVGDTGHRSDCGAYTVCISRDPQRASDMTLNANGCVGADTS